MSQRSEFHNLDQPFDGLLRELAAGGVTKPHLFRRATRGSRW